MGFPPGPFVVPAPYIRGYPNGTPVQPTDAFVIDRAGVGTMYVTGLGTGGNLQDGIYTNATVTILNGTIVTVVAGTITRSVQFIINGGGNTISTGIAGDLDLPFNATLTACRLLADESCTCAVRIWLAPFADYPPTSANNISGTSGAVITASDHGQQDLSGWLNYNPVTGTVPLTAGTLRYDVISNDNAITLTIAMVITTP